MDHRQIWDLIMSELTYLPGAEPLFLEGSSIGCLLLHGAGGGTTWDLKEFAYYLHSQLNATIALPALSGFGTKQENLTNIQFDTWVQDTQEALTELKKTCNSIIIVGHSFGGLLGLLLASKKSAIDVIITWAAVHTISYKRLTIVPYIMKIPLFRSFLPMKIPITPSEELVAQGWVGYDWMPISIVPALAQGIKILKKSLHLVTYPTFIVQGTDDEIISKKSPQIIYDQINSNTKEIWLINGAKHPLMQDPKFKEVLFDRTLKFIRQSLNG